MSNTTNTTNTMLGFYANSQPSDEEIKTAIAVLKARYANYEHDMEGGYSEDWTKDEWTEYVQMSEVLPIVIADLQAHLE